MTTDNSAIQDIITTILDDGPELLPQLRDEIERMTAAFERDRQVSVTTAVPLTNEEVTQLQQALGKIFNRSVDAIQRLVDKQVLGGLKVQIGDYLIDATVQAQIRRMKETLLS